MSQNGTEQSVSPIHPENRDDLLLPSKGFRHRTFLFVSACLCGYLFLLLLYKLFPGLMPDTAVSVLEMGQARCIANLPGIFHLACPSIGYPYGSPSTFGLPLTALAANTSEVFRVPVEITYRIVDGVALGVAFAGCIKLFHRIADNRWIALAGALLFLASPIVSREGGYGALRIAFALLPAYVCVNLSAIDRFGKPRVSIGTAVALFAALSATHAFALFCDGYSFVMELLLSGLLWAAWLFTTVRNRSFGRALAGSLVSAASVVVAIVAYKAYIPASQYVVMPLDMFRGQGVDLYMLFVPSAVDWLAQATGWHHTISGYQAYSDGPSSSFVYLGYSFLACGVACAWMSTKRGTRERRLVALILAAAFIAMVVSFGPALKWHDIRSGAPDHVSFDSYRMPLGAATLELGTGWLYQNVPGVDLMRALYRWQLLVRLALVVSAVSMLALAVRNRRHAIAGLLVIALFAETLPSPMSAIAEGRQSMQSVMGIDRQPIPELRANVRAGSKAVFLQLHPGASQNPFLATYLCAMADITCYNVGGDKNTELASESWPAPVYELIAGENIELNVDEIFRRHLADVIIVPFFDLRAEAYSWPPANFPTEAVKGLVRSKLGNCTIHATRWFAFVTPGDSGNAATTPTGDFTPGHIASVANWGPHAINIDDNQAAYLWVQSTDSAQGASIAIGDQVLPTLRHDSTTIAAPIRRVADRAALAKATSFPVFLVDRKKRIRQRIGDVAVSRTH